VDSETKISQLHQGQNSNDENVFAKSIETIDLLNVHPLSIIEWDGSRPKLKRRPSYSPSKVWQMSIMPQVGIYYTDRSISLQSVSGQDLQEYRESTERTLETLSLGIDIEFQHQSNLYLSGGLHLNQLTEQFATQSSEFTTESIEIVQEINFLANGVVEEVAGMFDQGQETITMTTSYNTLRWAELSTGGGYRFDLDRWQFGAGAGLMWGALLNAEGRILDGNQNIIQIEDQSTNIYRSNIGLGGYGHLDIRYAIHPRISLSTQLGYKFYGSSFTEPDYPLDISYQWWGGRIGVSYQLF